MLGPGIPVPFGSSEQGIAEVRAEFPGPKQLADYFPASLLYHGTMFQNLEDVYTHTYKYICVYTHIHIHTDRKRDSPQPSRTMVSLRCWALP